jgi:PKD domain
MGKFRVGLCAIVWAAALSLATIAPAQQIVNISNAPLYQRFPLLNDHGDILYTGQVLELGYPTPRDEVFLFDAALGSARQLTVNTPSLSSPAFNNRSDAVWSSSIGSGWRVQAYDAVLQLVETMLVRSGVQQSYPEINDARQIFWMETSDTKASGTTDIFRYDLPTRTTANLTGAAGTRPGEANWGVQLNRRGDAAWYRDRKDGLFRLMFYDSDSNQVLELSASGQVPFPIAVSEDKHIVYQQNYLVGTSQRVGLFVADAVSGQVINLGELSGNPDTPLSVVANSRGDVAWQAVYFGDNFDNVVTGHYLYLADTGTVESLPALANMSEMAINDGRQIAFTQTVNGQTDLFRFDFGSGRVAQITNDALSEGAPRINASGQIAWQAYDPAWNDIDVYLYTPPVNTPPTAVIALVDSAYVGENVSLDGSGSSDPEGDPLTYAWTLSAPDGSLAHLSDATAVAPSFDVDVPGEYTATLVVNDGLADSAPASLSIQAVTLQDAAATTLVQTTGVIAALPAISADGTPVLKNSNMGNALTNKIDAALADIAAGDYATALSKLENDIRPKTDGCATGGAPDRNDWIRTCPEQAQVYAVVTQAIAYLRLLVP